jgi:hypothetical protein
MELLETQDPLKRQLIESSDRYKQELQRDVKEVSEKTERVVKNALIIGGALALGYILVNQLSSSSHSKRRKVTKVRAIQANDDDAVEVYSEPTLISKIGTQVLNQATFMLLEVAKEKLAEYLQTKQKSE